MSDSPRAIVPRVPASAAGFTHRSQAGPDRSDGLAPTQVPYSGLSPLPLYDLDRPVREEIVKESVIYQDILQEGREKGREEGREKGREEGKEEGKQLSQQEWVESLLLSKFGEIDPALARIIPSLVILSTSELAPLLLSADREQLLQRFGSES